MGFHPDLGSIPAWIGAGSLLLAFRIFLRDRSKSERAQVEAVGVWADIKREPISPRSSPGLAEAEVRIRIKNGSDLPIEVSLLFFTFNTLWGIPLHGEASPFSARRFVPGKPDAIRHMGPGVIAPQETWDSEWFWVNLAHTASSNDVAELAISNEGVKCIVHCLVIDNAGRRWEARQRRGKPARRIRWYSRPGKYYPMEWESLIWRKFWAFKAKLKERTRSIRKRSPAAQSERPELHQNRGSQD